ncbi:hypothetical protein [Actinoallomurus iriomotensis]|uniref:Uncharacterized protein n=1 Tax=Actinoallomurus iriomotensis TaxID=478107 RepID=A0A9W6SB19_9ACTN|nr:hypothetical protein [Actinoallomurus iriomotensis]GLY89207.1 hypothetical protein Airi02_071360 [Actinoallomurus iriomotensis]
MSEKSPGALLSEHLGLVEAPVDRVRTVVLNVPTGELSGPDVPVVLGSARTVTVSGGPATFTADAGTPIVIDVDREAGWVQAHGEWWWCVRLQVEPHPDGALVRRSAYNRATGAAGRLVPYTVGRGHRRQGHAALLGLLDDLGSRLGCDTRLLPE